MTDNERKLLNVIEAYHKEHGYMPSYAEMCELTGIKSKSYIKDLMYRLIKKGYISIDYDAPLMARAFRLGKVYD